MIQSQTSTRDEPSAEIEPLQQLPKKQERIAVLDGIRGTAILLVLLFHVVFDSHPSSRIWSALLAAGRLTWSGVDLFFVLSGFLIGGILLDKRDSPHYFRTFYVRRAYRILPLYFALLATFAIRFLPWVPASGNFVFSMSPIPWLSYLTFTQNLWMGLLGTLGSGTLAATWSLAIEEQFYLTAPLVVRLTSRRHLIRVLLAVVFLVPLARIAVREWFVNGAYANYVWMPCRADSLSLGILCALVIRSNVTKQLLIRRFQWLRAFVLFMFFSLVLLSRVGSPFSGPMVTYGYSCLALFYAACLLVAVLNPNGLLGRVFALKVLRHLGSLAYFTYLFHLPVMEMCRRVLALHFSYDYEPVRFTSAITGVGLTLVLASLSFRYFEGPLLRRGHRHRY